MKDMFLFKKKSFSLLILLSVIFLFTTITSISENKPETYYFVGQKITFDLRDFNNYTIKVNFPNGSQFLKKGSSNLIILELNESGEYFVELNYLNRIETYSFKVLDILVENFSYKNPFLKFKKFDYSEGVYTNLSNVETDKDILIKNERIINTDENLEFDIPEYALDIKIKNNGLEKKYSIKNDIITLIKKTLSNSKNKTITFRGEKGIVEVSYVIPGPKKIENKINERKKEIKVYSEAGLSFENIKVSTFLDSLISIRDKNKIKVFWKERNSFLDFNVLDLNSDGFIDKLEWNTSLYSNQTFELIIEISKAEHLDENRGFVEDIYEEVKALDGVWSPAIKEKEYVRITFEKNLTKENDITIFPRVVSGNPRIEVYEIDGNEKIAEFSEIKSNEYNKVFLTNLKGEQQIFDLRIVGGIVEFDYIVDPTFNVSNYSSRDIALTVLDNRTFVLAFVGNNSLSFIVYDTNGTNLTSPIVVDPTMNENSRVSLSTINESAFLIGWFDGPSRNISYAAYYRNGTNFISARQAEVGGVVGATGTQAIDVDIQDFGDVFHFCYMDVDENQADLRIINYSVLGTGTEITIDNNARPESVSQNIISCEAINGSLLVYTWFDDQSNDASYAVLNKQGAFVVSGTDFDSAIGETAQIAVTTLNRDRFVGAWFDIGGGDTGSIEFSIIYWNGSVIVADQFVEANAGSTSRLALTPIETPLSSIDAFVLAWVDSDSSTIKATVYNATGSLLYGPYVIASDYNTSSLLFHIYAKDPSKNISLCPGKYIFSYTNNQGKIVFKTLNIDGSDWSGVCEEADTTPPIVNLISPVNNSIINSSLDFKFIFNVSDESLVSNCSLFIDDEVKQASTSITREKNQTFFQYVSNGLHSWKVGCFDEFGNYGESLAIIFFANSSYPPFSSVRFYETYPTSFSQNELAVIWLNNTRDSIQNNVSFQISPLTSRTIVNAYTPFMGNNGAVLRAGNVVFSSSFGAANNNIRVSWKLFISNSSGQYLFCRIGDDAAGGIQLSSATVSATNSTCLSSLKRLSEGDSILLVITLYNTNTGTTQTVTHVWDGATSSFVDMNLTTEGFLRTNLSFPSSDFEVNLSSQFNVTCNVSCSVGFCTNTYLYIQYNSTSQGWTNISSSGNIILASGETNGKYLGSITNNSIIQNFSLVGNVISENNLRCVAISSYDQNISNTRRVYIGAGMNAPNITLISPLNNSWLNSSLVIFYYNISDVNDNIANATLILNGQRNITNQTPILNNQINNFSLTLSDGIYNWSVNATDTTNLEGTANETRIFYVDTQKPRITLIYPENLSYFEVSTITFNFSVVDNLDSNLTCNLSIDGSNKHTNFGVENNTIVSKVVSGISLGNHSWYVSCIDKAKNYNISEIRNFTVNDLPPQVFLLTPNMTWFNSSSINLSYNASDNNNLAISYLFINGALNQTNQTPILNNQINNFSLFDLSDGLYWWFVNVTDDAGFSETSSPRIFYIDTKKPLINLLYPSDGFLSGSSNVYFSFSVTDNLASKLVCNLSVGEIKKINFLVDNSSNTGFLISNLTDGLKFWNVSCIDYANNFNISESRNITIVEPPKIYLITSNNSYFNSSNVNLSYLPFDNTNISECRLYLNNNFNQTNNTPIILGVQNNFSLNLSDGFYEWYVNCTDSYGLVNFSETRFFRVDTQEITIELFYPTSGIELFTKEVTFSYRVNDSNDNFVNCSIIINGEVGDSVMAESNNITNRTIYFSKGGLKFWNVSCRDFAGNSKTSETRNFTLAFSPDIYLVSPLNNSWLNSSLVIFYYNISDVNDNIANATLILNGQRNITNQTSILNNQINNFSLTLSDGIYNWSVNATDTTNLEGSANETRIFYVDTKSPLVLINSPLNNSILSWNNLSINYTVLDNFNSTSYCNITLNGFNEFEEHPSPVNISNVLYAIREDGEYSLIISCRDLAGNFNSSEEVFFKIEAPPNISLILPTNFSRFSNGNITFVYFPSDPIGISNCSLILDGSYNVSSDIIFNNQNNSFFVSDIKEGVHNWTIECYDAYPDFNNNSPDIFYFVVDKTPPIIILNSPLNDSGIYRNTSFLRVYYNFSAIDFLDTDIYCNLTLNDKLDKLNLLLTNNTFYYNYWSNLNESYYNWSVTCRDSVNNTNSSSIFYFNYTYPDFLVNSSFIYLNSSEPKEGETVLINSTIFNLGGADGLNVLVDFFAGNPLFGGVKIGESKIVNISKFSNYSVYELWNASLGQTELYIVIDSPIQTNGSYYEWNETNNLAFNLASVGAWHIFTGYLNYENEILLGDNLSNKKIINWSLTNFDKGYIFVSDYDSYINWEKLVPLGKDLENKDSFDDFDDLDLLLNMTNFSDSIKKTFTDNGYPKQRINFTLLGKEIKEAPIVNSTNTSSFITGILWDSSKSSDIYYDSLDKEEIVFFTFINLSKEGAYGIYDYEIRVPAKLREYIGTENKKVAFYVFLD